MKGGTKPRGFTIVETLIFLAVSGMLLGVALGIINGKQNTTEFNQGIRQIENQIQTVVSNVAEGQYPNLGNFTTCTGSLGVAPIPTSSGSNTQGTNLTCELIGEAIQFQNNQFIVYPMIGNTYSNLATLTSVSTLAQAYPQALVRGTIDDSQTIQLPYSLTTGSVGGSVLGRSIVGIFSLGATTVGSSGTIKLISIGSALSDSKTTGINDINTQSNYGGGLTPLPNGTTVCFNDGSTSRKGLITIGANDNPTNVDLTIASGVCP